MDKHKDVTGVSIRDIERREYRFRKTQKNIFTAKAFGNMDLDQDCG